MTTPGSEVKKNGNQFFFSVEKNESPHLHRRGSKEEASFERFVCFLSRTRRDDAELFFHNLSRVLSTFAMPCFFILSRDGIVRSRSLFELSLFFLFLVLGIFSFLPKNLRLT